ncbi:UDP-glucose 4-epimerase [Fulvivirga imtechensis AK7]|uniref:UDP-glucose 4-epimerase n=1 Tax=Fulvivirga imtechensis AK7 TaxID=1237149 RepID=L8JQD3_9BACT|nr:NAD(P)-dependent oxidoreductase [Fulvivirga imtechensis]ELR71166.1 UDP-glucose 4-epimerase [Fulvivirga imtechensis AK7]
MKILVTGSSGHLGEAIIKVLKDADKSFVGVDIKPSEFTTHVGSITDRTFVGEVIAEGVDYILHTATLHKPHVATHSNQDFVDVNITGTLNLLEEARRNNVKAFIYTSTTSTFGDMLTPKAGEPAIWVTEETRSIPKNIYGVTKSAAEDLCQMFFRNHNLPCIILKTSRFFPEEDDNQEVRLAYADLNIKANEYLHRRVDIEDAAKAHLLAIEKAAAIGFSKYIISATSPFTKDMLVGLNRDAIAVVKGIYPEAEEIFKKAGWWLFPKIGRVYVNEKARNELGWRPKYDFKNILNCLREGKDFRSNLSLSIDIKGYHEQKFQNGPYPVSGH